MVILIDFISYWLHRAFHGRRLWPFHAVHHSSVDLDWLSAARVHPLNDIVNRMLQAAIVVALGMRLRCLPARCLSSLLTRFSNMPTCDGTSARCVWSLPVQLFTVGITLQRKQEETRTSPGCCRCGIFCLALT